MSSQSPSSEHDDFGANEWLVEELFEQYSKDKNSVDAAWQEFFATYQPGSSNSSAPASTSTSGSGAKAAPRTEKPMAAEAPRDQQEAPAQQAAEPTRTAESEPQKLDPKQAEGHTPLPTPRDQGDGALGDVPAADDKDTPLKGIAAKIVQNMEASIEVPTATSVRAVPAKALIDNRIVINSNLARGRGGKVSFTHIIGYAIIKALRVMPEMNASLSVDEKGKPVLHQPGHINFGLAIDLQKPDGSRTLVVPSIKGAEAMTFAQFWAAYEEMVKKARNNKLTLEDYAGTTISLTNPGGIGTVHSVPRLMKGAGAIIGVGALDYPAEWQGASNETLNRNAVSKILTLTSTYDHRIIQGAQSGEFLKTMHHFLIGGDEFYDDVFRSLRIPYEPIRWVQDISTTHEDDINKTARVQELIRSMS